MLRKGHILAILVIAVSAGTIATISAQESQIPSWIKNTVGFWVKGDVSDQEFLNAVKWMLENNVLDVTTQKEISWHEQYDRLDRKNNALEKRLAELKQDSPASSPSYYDPAPKSSRVESQSCSGYAACFSSKVTQVVDGDTIKVDDNSIRFSLVDTPEVGQYGYGQAKDFINKICPPGSTVLVDEDDLQTQGSYGRMIAVIYCNGMNLNKAILDQGYGKIDTYFCKSSEFEYEGWAQQYGCAAKKTQNYTPPTTKTEPAKTEQPKSEPPKAEPPKSEPPKAEPPKSEPPKSEPPKTEPVKTAPSCDPSYPDFCIPPPPPDLDCKDIPQKNFTVLQPDPHRFDGDKDGIGCEG